MTPMPRPARRAVTALAAWLLPIMALLLAAAAARAQGMCPGEPLCRQVPAFTATVTDFRASPSTLGPRPLVATVRFTNRGSAPLILGLVDRTAAAYDDRGNRYEVGSGNKVLGIGLVERNRFDPKFTLGPGESADARIELSFFVNRDVIVGTRYDLEMSVREIETLPGSQYRLGREHLLSWQSLADRAGARAPAAAATPPPAPAPSAEPPAVATAQQGDACQGAPNCAHSGPVLAKVVGATPSVRGTYHYMTLRVAIQNLGSEPLIINYKESTGEAIDERGQTYIVDSRDAKHVQGIPVSTRERASSQFMLGPGETRQAQFVYGRYTGKVPAGSVLNTSLALEQYELLPSNQLRLVREHALAFGEVRAGGAAPDLRQLGQTLKGLGDALRGKP